MGGRSGAASTKGKWRSRRQGKYSGKQYNRETIKFDGQGKTSKKN